MSLAPFLFGWPLWLAPPTAIPSEGPPRSVEAVRTQEEMKIDGAADEAVWNAAPHGRGFQEREPNLGGEPEFATSFQVAYDENFLYVLVRADIPADQVRVRTLQRDSFGIFGDSTISVKLDPHHDRRSAVNLAVNADGAQVDIMSLEDGRVGIREWDAVWEAEVGRRDDGYDAEFKIPFAILGIKGGKASTMGIDITRDEPIRNATFDWRLIVPPRHPVSASSFGTLTGLTNVKAQRALEFTPYLAASTDFEPVFRLDPRRRANLAAGADARLQVGAGSYVEASVLTDFAQVEADQVQVANDRFPLFFPERRPFFINGLDVFNFGRPREAQLFFSRRIGLDGGAPTPIAGGVKAYGRSGPISYGVLNVQTLRRLPHDQAEEDDESFERVAPENFTVARVRMQTGRYASLGILGVGKHRVGEADHDLLSGGIDGELRALEGKLRTYAFIATNYSQVTAQEAEIDEIDGTLLSPATPADEKVGYSAHALAEYQGLYVRPGINWIWSDEQFEAPLGFYRRPGTASQSAWIKFAPRPRFWGLREVEFGPRGNVTTDPLYTDILTRDWGHNFRMRWRVPWSLSYDVSYLQDEVFDAFEIYGYEVAPKEYAGFRHGAGLSSPGRQFISADFNYNYSQRFGGEAHEFRGKLRLRASKHFSLEGTYTHLLGHLEDEASSFDFGYLNGTVLVAIHRNLIWDNLVRYSLQPSNERVGLQSRIRWRYMPGSDIFLVYRNDIPLEEAAAAEDASNFHSLTLKATFYLRMLLRR
jgi:hypothetical protein